MTCFRAEDLESDAPSTVLQARRQVLSSWGATMLAWKRLRSTRRFTCAVVSSRDRPAVGERPDGAESGLHGASWMCASGWLGKTQAENRTLGRKMGDGVLTFVDRVLHLLIKMNTTIFSIFLLVRKQVKKIITITAHRGRCRCTHFCVQQTVSYIPRAHLSSRGRHGEGYTYSPNQGATPLRHAWLIRRHAWCTRRRDPARRLERGFGRAHNPSWSDLRDIRGRQRRRTRFR